jgi:pyruvate dehydrogenase E1 component beta subunit
MIYKEALMESMSFLAAQEKTIFLGQEAYYFYGTMIKVPKEKIIDLPIMEDAQMGMSIGLSINGFIPISLYTRMDFLLLAMNQLVNHLDKIKSMSDGQFKPRVIIRTVVGETKPLHPGPQHTQDFTYMLGSILNSIIVVKRFRIKKTE